MLVICLVVSKISKMEVFVAGIMRVLLNGSASVRRFPPILISADFVRISFIIEQIEMFISLFSLQNLFCVQFMLGVYLVVSKIP